MSSRNPVFRHSWGIHGYLCTHPGSGCLTCSFWVSNLSKPSTGWGDVKTKLVSFPVPIPSWTPGPSGNYLRLTAGHGLHPVISSTLNCFHPLLDLPFSLIERRAELEGVGMKMSFVWPLHMCAPVPASCFSAALNSPCSGSCFPKSPPQKLTLTEKRKADTSSL